MENDDDLLNKIEADLFSNDKNKYRNSLILMKGLIFSIRSGVTYKSDNAEAGIFNIKKKLIMIRSDNNVSLV